MEAKLKAKELVLKYEKYLFDKFTTDEDWVKCVECALIAVEEILNHHSQEQGLYRIDTFYWQQVKNEIENL
jgi:hypothetical protein